MLDDRSIPCRYLTPHGFVPGTIHLFPSYFEFTPNQEWNFRLQILFSDVSQSSTIDLDAIRKRTSTDEPHAVYYTHISLNMVNIADASREIHLIFGFVSDEQMFRISMAIHAFLSDPSPPVAHSTGLLSSLFRRPSLPTRSYVPIASPGPDFLVDMCSDPPESKQNSHAEGEATAVPAADQQSDVPSAAPLTSFQPFGAPLRLGSPKLPPYDLLAPPNRALILEERVVDTYPKDRTLPVDNRRGGKGQSPQRLCLPPPPIEMFEPEGMGSSVPLLTTCMHGQLLSRLPPHVSFRSWRLLWDPRRDGISMSRLHMRMSVEVSRRESCKYMLLLLRQRVALPANDYLPAPFFTLGALLDLSNLPQDVPLPALAPGSVQKAATNLSQVVGGGHFIGGQGTAVFSFAPLSSQLADVRTLVAGRALRDSRGGLRAAPKPLLQFMPATLQDANFVLLSGQGMAVGSGPALALWEGAGRGSSKGGGATFPLPRGSSLAADESRIRAIVWGDEPLTPAPTPPPTSSSSSSPCSVPGSRVGDREGGVDFDVVEAQLWGFE